MPVTATLADDDRPTSGTVMWQWARSPNGRTDWVEHRRWPRAPPSTPTLDDDEGNYIRATASYMDGARHSANKTAEEVSARVGDAPPVNSAPVFPSTETGQREVAEDETGAAVVRGPRSTANGLQQ